MFNAQRYRNNPVPFAYASADYSRLGLVPNGKRSVTPVPARLLALVPKPKNIEVEIESNADPLQDTVPFMKKRIAETVYQVEKLVQAPELRGTSLHDTVRKYYNFIFRHIQYVKDPDNVEAVRDPATLIHQGKGDCDCFTVCLGAMLMAAGIPFKIRVAAYRGEWQHVYIVVPKNGDASKELTSRSQYYTVDPVVHKFDYEEPFSKKRDFAMRLVSLQGGMGACNTSTQSGSTSNGGTTEKKPVIMMLRRYIFTEQVVDEGLVPTQKFLEANKIPYAQSFSDKDSGEFVIDTPGGELKIPTIITKAQAEELKTLMQSAGAQASAVATSLKSNLQWWIIGGLALLWFLSGDGKKESVQGLSGPGKNRKAKNRKQKTGKRKAKRSVLDSFSI
jgi:hypothetical protein